jgi:hypothetical protein
MRMLSKKSNGIFVFGLIAAATAGFSTPAFGQATRTWVSGVGDDVNPCSRTAPCKTFAGAISKTAAGGEISCLDPGGFGTINITKSLTIDCHGTNGSILAANTNGVIVNAAAGNVTLRNLTINGAGDAPNNINGNGVRILGAARVTIDNVVIENFSGTGTQGRGISVETSAGTVRVSVMDTHITNTNNGAIRSAPTGGNVLMTLNNVVLSDGGSSAIDLVSATQLTLRNSLVSGFVSGSGLLVEQTSNQATVMDSAIVNNLTGITNGSGGGAPTTRLFASVISGNTLNGILINGGAVASFTNNGVAGNSGNNTPSSQLGPN